MKNEWLLTLIDGKGKTKQNKRNNTGLWNESNDIEENISIQLCGNTLKGLNESSLWNIWNTKTDEAGDLKG